MAIVNMCTYSEDIKAIFLRQSGLAIINELLESKDEDILLNNLRLIMTLITQKKSEFSHIGKTLAEDSDYKIIRRLIVLIKEGLGINFCILSK